MEAWLPRHRSRQQGKDLLDLEEASRPLESDSNQDNEKSAVKHVILTSMDKQQWNSVRTLALLMHVVHVQRAETIDRDVDGELRQYFVQFRLSFLPVEAILPVSYKTLDVRERRPVFPTGIRQLVGEACKFEISTKVLKS